MSRSRKARGHVSRERWLVSYADFITLLFAFFVVLYASTQGDSKKIAQVSTAIRGGFQELGVFSASAPVSIVRAETVPPVREANVEAAKFDKITDTTPNPAVAGGGSGPDVSQLRRELEDALGEEIKKHEIQMRVTPEGLVVSMSEVGFFKSGEAKLLPGGQSTLTRIARVLNAQGFQIRVEGHTDNAPIHRAQFKSNWELSTARATEVVSLLVERYGLDPRSVSAAGYSEYRPVASNDTAEGRQTNRRVDLVVVSRVYRGQIGNPGGDRQGP